MVDPATLRRAGFRALFLGAAALIVFFRILPVDPGRAAGPTPDLLLLLMLAWVIRRPGDLPVWLIAALALFADVIFVRPLGLEALLTVLGAEALRRRAKPTADRPFLAEWLLVAAVLLALTLARVVILGLTLVPQPGLGAIALDYAVTAATYPAVVLACAVCFGVRARPERRA